MQSVKALHLKQRRAERIRKTIHSDKKRISAKYNHRLFLLNLPSVAVLISAFAVAAIFFYIADDGSNVPTVIFTTLFYCLYFASLYSFIVCLVGSIISHVFLKAHSEHTYIEISDSYLVISQHDQTVFNEGRFRSYKKLWIIHLKDVEQVECIKNHIIVTAKARYFNEDAEWLHYERGEDGIDFDNWWYNKNGGKDVQSVEITDFYTHGERIVKRILFCSNKVIDRTQRRERFRQEMLEIARNTKKRKGISDKYEPPKYRTFR